MKRAYVILHWVLTILLAPLISQTINYIWGTTPHQVVGLLEVYPITLLFSMVFSLPTFLIYLTCFHFLARGDVNLVISKLILITVSVLGIIITQKIIKGSMSQDIVIAYSITAILVGLVLKLKATNARTVENSITK
jgi:hypothetical protein